MAGIFGWCRDNRLFSRSSSTQEEGPLHPYPSRSHVGYDFDGVLSSERGLLFRIAFFTRSMALARLAQLHAKCLLRPRDGIIISCRREWERPQTEAWLRHEGINLPLILARDAEDKATNIRRLTLTDYFENDVRVAAILREECPRTRIHLTGEIRSTDETR